MAKYDVHYTEGVEVVSVKIDAANVIIAPHGVELIDGTGELVGFFPEVLSVALESAASDSTVIADANDDDDGDDDDGDDDDGG